MLFGPFFLVVVATAVPPRVSGCRRRDHSLPLADRPAVTLRPAAPSAHPAMQTARGTQYYVLRDRSAVSEFRILTDNPRSGVPFTFRVQ